jgi:hypothetical protein
MRGAAPQEDARHIVSGGGARAKQPHAGLTLRANAPSSRSSRLTLCSDADAVRPA